MKVGRISASPRSSGDGPGLGQLNTVDAFSVVSMPHGFRDHVPLSLLGASGSHFDPEAPVRTVNWVLMLNTI